MAPEPVRRFVPSLLVAVLLAALPAGCATGEPDRQPAVSGAAPPAAEPGESDSGVGRRADAALLPADELGPGWRMIDGTPGRPRWPWAQDDCPGYRDGEYPAQQHRTAAVQRGYTHGSSAALQVIEVYQPGWAERAMADARRVIEVCPTYGFLGGQVEFTLLDDAPVGDDALVVRGRIEHPGGPATVSYFISVRRGDLVSTLNLPDPGPEQRVRTITGVLLAFLGQVR